MARKVDFCPSKDQQWKFDRNYSWDFPGKHGVVEEESKILQNLWQSVGRARKVPEFAWHELLLGRLRCCTNPWSCLGYECCPCWGRDWHPWCHLWAWIDRNLSKLVCPVQLVACSLKKKKKKEEKVSISLIALPKTQCFGLYFAYIMFWKAETDWVTTAPIIVLLVANFQTIMILLYII